MDVGCHLGYYSLLAARMGHEVVAIDANAECLSVLQQTLDQLHPELAKAIHVHHARVGPTPLPDLVPPGPIVMLKMDLEGGEPAVMRGAQSLLPFVQNAVVEISPKFADRTPLKDYISLVRTMIDAGFHVFDIGLSPPRAFKNPRGAIARIVGSAPCLTRATDAQVARHLRGIPQTNFFFSRRPRK